jgi:hypothetical protein
MKKLFIAALGLSCAAANAQIQNCPADAGGALLSNARMFIGPRNDAHALHGDVEQVEDGTNIHYNFTGESPRWLVCQYGGKRIEGTAISAPEVIGGRESWIQLGPMVDTCDLAIRKAMAQTKTERTWTAVATCRKRQPPPPDMA